MIRLVPQQFDLDFQRPRGTQSQAQRQKEGPWDQSERSRWWGEQWALTRK
jgi:hypothetical protein